MAERLYAAVKCEPRHAEAVARLDQLWVDEETAPWRGRALTAAAVREKLAEDSVLFLVLVDCSHGSDGPEACVGFAWVDMQPDTRDIPLDGRPHKKLAELEYIYIHQDHRGGGGGKTLWEAVERGAVDAGCTYLELIADSVRAEELLSFYSKVCGMDYMFMRLRKELAGAPEKLPPLPIPFMRRPPQPPTPAPQPRQPELPRQVDFGSSFCLLNSPTLGTKSTARFTIDAGCEVQNERTGKNTTVWLTNPCIGENMYKGSDLIDLPAGELSVIFEDGGDGRFVFDKRFGDRSSDTRLVRRLGEEMSLRPGVRRTIIADLGCILPRGASNRVGRCRRRCTSLVSPTACKRLSLLRRSRRCPAASQTRASPTCPMTASVRSPTIPMSGRRSSASLRSPA